jgi:hypothetical protein
MGKKAKGGDGGGGGKAPKEALPSEAEASLLLKVGDLEERLTKALQAADGAVVGHRVLSDELATQKREQKDIVDYLNHQLDKAKEDYKDLEARYAVLLQEKEEKERTLNTGLGNSTSRLKATEKSLADAEAEVKHLRDQVTEIGQLRNQREADVTEIDEMTTMLEQARHELREQDKHLKVLALAGERVVGEGGVRAVPLILLEAVRMHIGKEVLCEQAMVGLQAVLSTERHSDAELVRYRGGVQLVLDAMARHEMVGELQSAACGLLWKLGFADPAVRDVVLQASGIPLIMGAMQRHPDHPRLHYNACGALRHLLVTAPRDFSKESQIAPGTRTEPTLPPIGSGSRVGGLGNRASFGGAGGGKRGPNRGLPHDPRTLPMSLSSSTSHPRLRGSAAMSGTRSDPRMATVNNSTPGPRTPMMTPASKQQTAAAGLLSSAGRRATADEGETRLAAREDVSVQALRLTLQSMDAHPQIALVQEYGCGTLFNIALANLAMRARIVDEGGVPAILRAMREHPATAGVQVNGCALVKTLAEYQPALQQIELGKGRALLLQAMQTHQYNEDLITRATEALRYLPEELPIPEQ